MVLSIHGRLWEQILEKYEQHVAKINCSGAPLLNINIKLSSTGSLHPSPSRLWFWEEKQRHVHRTGLLHEDEVHGHQQRPNCQPQVSHLEGRTTSGLGWSPRCAPHALSPTSDPPWLVSRSCTALARWKSTTTAPLIIVSVATRSPCSPASSSCVNPSSTRPTWTSPWIARPSWAATAWTWSSPTVTTGGGQEVCAPWAGLCVCVCGCTCGKGMTLGHKCCITGCEFVGLCHCFIPSVQLRGSPYHIWWSPIDTVPGLLCRTVLVFDSVVIALLSLLIIVVCTYSSTYVSGSWGNFQASLLPQGTKV